MLTGCWPDRNGTNNNWYSRVLCWLAAVVIGMEQTTIGIVVPCVDWLLAGSGWKKQQLV
jgi:hypothetical protein